MQRYLPLLPTRGRPRTHPLRRILDAIFYVVRTGCAWRYLPNNFPPWQTVFYHFRRLRLTGRWHLLYTALHRAERKAQTSETLIEVAIIRLLVARLGTNGAGSAWNLLHPHFSAFQPRVGTHWAGARLHRYR